MGQDSFQASVDAALGLLQTCFWLENFSYTCHLWCCHPKDITSIPQGSCVVRGQCTYTAQNAWIQNASLRNNILMGRPLYQARYDAVVRACALEQDLQALPAGA